MELPAWLAELYAPVDFSICQGFPHEHRYIDSKVIQRFNGYGDAVQHDYAFDEFINNNSLFNQDTNMNYFPLVWRDMQGIGLTALVEEHSHLLQKL